MLAARQYSRRSMPARCAVARALSGDIDPPPTPSVGILEFAFDPFPKFAVSPEPTGLTQTIRWPLAAASHSRQREEFYKLVEKLCPVPRYAYLFARHSPGEKWDLYGDDAPLLQAAE
jgi:hypothetical protein